MVNFPHRRGLNLPLPAGRAGNFITVFTTALAFGFAFGFAFVFGFAAAFVFGVAFAFVFGVAFAFVFGFAFTTAVGVGSGSIPGGKKVKGNAIIGSVGPADGTSGSGAGGSSRGASLRIFKGGDIVLVDSAVGAAMLASGAAMVVRVDSSVAADNVRTAVPGVEGDIEPLLADGRPKSVAAGKA